MGRIGRKIKGFFRRVGHKIKHAAQKVAAFGRKVIHGAAKVGRKVLNFGKKVIEALHLTDIPVYGDAIKKGLEIGETVVGGLEKVDNLAQKRPVEQLIHKTEREVIQKVKQGDYAGAYNASKKIKGEVVDGINRLSKQALTADQQRKLKEVLDRARSKAKETFHGSASLSGR